MLVLGAAENAIGTHWIGAYRRWARTSAERRELSR